ncbi:competence type IV pilus ATPase ComGA [Macrococcoides caseolyticum]|uniref:competence type IV pilus ATPase ComGA n=1 Tax=Macrococcoides caseolyticum TaxID=69966 RepID=UPI001F37C977|nr:competence type IV pilus ATPase ComGA [Macrococcus caseolyticus]MCE4956110.1 Flp pilus assembly complex ATPase component TadA [Macrococcus caseolyticus]
MEKILNAIVDEAISKKATDIHFIPGSESVLIKFRINSDMFVYRALEAHIFEKLLSYLKFIAHLDVSEKNKAQSGMLDYQKDKASYSIRASTLPQSIGVEACVLRIIPTLFQDDGHVEANLLKLMHKGSGLILISGPTGSGKSTLMYQMLHYANRLNKQIITIEDPVEQHLVGVVQINVNHKASITYQNALKAILRCDPDIIMIGEIRDSDTAKNVINASLSGHLVLTTIHANSCIGAIHRLQEMGVTNVEMEQCVEMIINQRLINTKEARLRIYESLNRQDVHAYLSGQQLSSYLPIGKQLEQLIKNHSISQMEYERYALE